MPDWDTLSADEKKVFTRQQEIFAAYAEVTDHEVGRVVQAIEDMGVLDNTLIIYITGDKGPVPMAAGTAGSTPGQVSSPQWGEQRRPMTGLNELCEQAR
jgi:arylsulfatase A-like enzyme